MMTGLYNENFITSHLQEETLLIYIQNLIAQVSGLMHEKDPNNSISSIKNQYAKDFIENAPVAVALLDNKLNFTYYSPKLVSLLSHLELIPQEESLRDKNIVDTLKHTPTRLKLALEASLKGKNIQYEMLKFNTESQHEKWVRFESTPWYDEKNISSHVLIFMEDITLRHETYLQNKKLQNTNLLLQNFALIFSHDLIQPLRQISNFLGLLRNYLSSTNDFSKNELFIEETINAMMKSVQQAKTLSEGVILYCKNGNLKLHQQCVSFLDVLKEVQDSCLNKAQFHLNNEISYDIYLYANRICLLQVFQNLLTNAIQYSKSRKPTITLSGEYIDSKFYRFSLHNDGVCPPELLGEKLFEAFESSKSNGSGLGLMICKKIIDAHKGKIYVESSEKEGTTVYFSLPIFEKKEYKDQYCLQEASFNEAIQQF